ncbi:MAG: alpha/beta hydrolase family protein [Dehalococcoidia bacterium]|nr:alpha/beta hydrolase family protein [Dehalococcoidia bacterium]
MNQHVLLDLFVLQMAAVQSGRDRFFRSSVRSAPITEHLQAVRFVSTPELTPGTHEMPADSLAGRVDPAFLVYKWQGNSSPTIIFHHGNQEHPFEMGGSARNTFRTVLADGAREIPANLIAIRAPYHRWPTRDYLRRMGDISNFAAMLSASVSLVDSIVEACHDLGSSPVVVSGIGLGGTVTNLHRTYYNTADLYVPLLAGAALGNVFTSSLYRRLVGGQGRRHPELVRELLDFEDDYQKVKTNNVFPLLARHDQYALLDRQSTCYEYHPIRIMERGHFTAALSPLLLRQHVADVLQGNVPAPYTP